MNDRTETTCPLCGSDQSVPAFDAAGHHYRRCRRCALLFSRGRVNANFQPSLADFEPAYLQYLDDGPIDRQNLDDVIGWIESHVSLANPEVRLLDVGSGSGKMVRRLRGTRPCQVSAIEPSITLFNGYQLAALGIESTTLPDVAARGGDRFDVVTVLDVFEHVPEPTEFLDALAAVTKPGGLAFLSTPDAHAPLARVLGRRWHHCNPYHFCLYGLKTLNEAARLHGFEAISSTHLWKRVPLDYFWNYTRDFVLRRPPRSRAFTPSRFAIPVNLVDTIYVVWRRR